MTKNFYEIAVRIQDASNPIAVTGELREAMMSAHHRGNVRKDPAVIAIFFKLYDMLGAPSEKEMYNALLKCEVLSRETSPHPVGKFGSEDEEKEEDEWKPRNGKRRAIPGTMGLVPVDYRRFKKEGKYWEKACKPIKKAGG